jgi:hypothetical protein
MSTAATARSPTARNGYTSPNGLPRYSSWVSSAGMTCDGSWRTPWGRVTAVRHSPVQNQKLALTALSCRGPEVFIRNDNGSRSGGHRGGPQCCVQPCGRSHLDPRRPLPSPRCAFGGSASNWTLTRSSGQTFEVKAGHVSSQSSGSRIHGDG